MTLVDVLALLPVFRSFKSRHAATLEGSHSVLTNLIRRSALQLAFVDVNTSLAVISYLKAIVTGACVTSVGVGACRIFTAWRR